MNELDEYLSLESDRVLRELVEGDPEGSESRIRVNVRPSWRHSPRPAAVRLAGGPGGPGRRVGGITLAHLDACLDLVHRQEGRGQIDLPNGLLVRREYESLVLCTREERRADRPARAVGAPRPDRSRGDPLGAGAAAVAVAETRELSLRDWPEGPDRGGFDVETVAPPVYLRGVRAGDRLEPMGMEGSQKLSDFFINQKVPRPHRTWVPLLCDNGGPERGERILWVVGRRRSRHAPVAPETSQVVLFQAETIV